MFRAPEMLEDPQYAAREAIVTVEHPVFGPIRMQNAFPKLSETPGEVRWSGTWEQGSHNREVYGELLGLSERELAELEAEGVL